MQFDHGLIAVTDLDIAAREFESRWGLASVEGGRHPDWGTANRIVPLGRSYLELIAVVDPAIAAEADLGRWVATNAAPTGRPLGWAVRPADLDEAASRLSLTVSSGARVTPSGSTLHWRSAGVDRAIDRSSLPFFIEWGAGVALPGTTPITHPAGAAEISGIHLRDDPGVLASWLGPGDHGLPIVVHAGPPAVAAIVIGTAGGEILIGDEST